MPRARRVPRAANAPAPSTTRLRTPPHLQQAGRVRAQLSAGQLRLQAVAESLKLWPAQQLGQAVCLAHHRHVPRRDAVARGGRIAQEGRAHLGQRGAAGRLALYIALLQRAGERVDRAGASGWEAPGPGSRAPPRRRPPWTCRTRPPAGPAPAPPCPGCSAGAGCPSPAAHGGRRRPAAVRSLARERPGWAGPPRRLTLLNSR